MNDDDIQRSDAITRAAGTKADWTQRALVAILGMTDGEWTGVEVLECAKRFAGSPPDASVWSKMIIEAERAQILEHTGRFKGDVPIYHVHSAARKEPA